MKKIILSKAIIQLIIDDYLANYSLNDIAKKYKLTRQKVKIILIENNIDIRSLSESAKLSYKKTKHTNLQQYGVENVFQSNSIKEKSKATCLEKYGTEFASQSPIFRDQVKQTNLEKYGTENPMQNEDIKQKAKYTVSLKSAEEKTAIILKAKQTKKALYGDENYNNLEKAIATNLKKYGVAYGVQTSANRTATNSPEAKAKAKIARLQTIQEKYGVDYYFQTLEFHKKARKLYFYDNELFDSKPELALWVYAKDNNIPIIRTPKKFEYVFDGKIHIYFPDFEIAGQLVEIKGDQFFDKNGKMCCPWNHNLDALFEAKHQCGLANNVIFLTKKDYTKYINYCKQINFNFKDYLME